MFSLDNFYNILSDQLLCPSNITTYGLFFPYGASDPEKFTFVQSPVTFRQIRDIKNKVLYFDQEPLSASVLDSWALDQNYAMQLMLYYKGKKLFANSEISDIKNKFCDEYHFYDWYYFFHGFAALEWYRDFQYITPRFETQFTKVFISLNHLMTKNRSYRLTLVANYIAKGILDNGIVSLPLSDSNGNVKQEIFNTNSQLSIASKKLIATHVARLPAPLIADTKAVAGNFSAKLNLEMEQSALWSVVSETVFYEDKLHLTEKVFKPIVACRPFMLVAAPGNLAYLKSYGFKTFDRWIDESYDSELDHDKRIDKITSELQRLSSMSLDQLRTMEKEMKDVLEHNFYHFYGDFKKRIVNELVDNFHNCVCQAANGDFGGGQVIRDGVDYRQVKLILAS